MLDSAVEKISYLTEPQWLEGRTGGLGGSDAAALLGLDPYKSAYQLYREKVGDVPAEDLADKEIVTWGKLLEPLVAGVYATKTKRQLIDHGFHSFRRTDFGFPCSASIDREIAPINGNGPGDLQIKTTGAFTQKDLEEELPLNWQVQVQHELAVTGWKWASLGILTLPARKLVYIDVERNDDFITTLLKLEKEFWQRILDRDPPPTDDSESTSRTLARLYPRDTGASVELPAAALEWDAKLQEAKAECSKWEKIKKDYENRFKDAIGTASLGIMPGGQAYSWKLQTRKAYEVKETSFRVLRRC